MSTEKIAIVGSVGCGKTVLLAVLTHCFQRRTEEGYQIIPDNQDATNFCLQRWAELQHCQWPAPTPPMEKPPVYRWKLINGTSERQMVTSDIAGEAWRSFIVEGVEANADATVQSKWREVKEAVTSIQTTLAQSTIEQHITSIENLLKDSSGIFLLLDLSQIINKEPGFDLAMFLPTALHQYMKKIGRADVPIFLVLSKTDKYRYVLEEKGDWQKVLETYLPWAPPFAAVIPVAAVANTKTVIRDGESEELPAPDFGSEGLKELYERIWQTMSKHETRKILRTLKWFCLIDVPVLLMMWIIYILVVAVSSSANFCAVVFWLELLAYGGIKVALYMIKTR